MGNAKTVEKTIEFDSRVNPYFPHQILMETTSACQLRCIMCAREAALEKGTLKVGHMEEWLAMKMIEEVATVSPKTRLWFCYFGEPTLSKEVWRRIRIAKDKGVETTVINSNGNMLIPKICDQLIESGLDEIYVGIDAATSDTYSKVRVRGHYDTVMNNMHYLLKHKKENLRVTVQYGVYKENEHEVEMFKKYWADYDVQIFIRPKLTWLGYLSEHNPTHENRYPCPWILDTLPVYYNGLVAYCSADWDNRLPVGDLKKQSIAEVWQTSYRKWQNRQLKGKFDQLPRFCQQCRDWQTKPLQGTLKQLFDHKLSFEDVHFKKPPHIKTKDYFV